MGVAPLPLFTPPYLGGIYLTAMEGQSVTNELRDCGNRIPSRDRTNRLCHRMCLVV
jgi:hypothetical protein